MDILFIAGFTIAIIIIIVSGILVYKPKENIHEDCMEDCNYECDFWRMK